MTTTMKPVLFNYFRNTSKVLKENYERTTEQYASAKLGKNRESIFNLSLNTVLLPKLKTKSGEIWDCKGIKTGQYGLIIIRDDSPSLDFGSNNTYLADSVYSGFSRLPIYVTPSKFIPHV